VSINAITPDPARIANLMQAYEDAVALFYREAVRGTDPDLQQFAEATLPTLQARLLALRSLQYAYPKSTIG
jgi:predicted outer membrane protein